MSDGLGARVGSGLRIAICSRSVSFTPGRGVGGMERAIAEQVRALQVRGVTVTLFAPLALASDLPRDVEGVDVPWPRWGMSRVAFSMAYVVWTRRLGRALGEPHDEFSVVHFHGASVGALRTGHIRGAPRIPRSVANPHGMEEFNRSNWARWLLRGPTRYLGRAARLADAVVATDESLVRVVRNAIGVAPSRIALIPNAVDYRYLRSIASDSGLDPLLTNIVSIGRVVPNKGYDLLVEALAIASQKGEAENWAWTHFGSGPDSAVLKARAGDLGIHLEIRSDRPDSEVQAALRDCDLFVQPSRYEGSSLTTLEAMSHGCRIVATGVGGIPDKILDGVSGYLCEADAGSLSEGIVRAITDNSDVGGTARALVEERFGIDASARAYVDLYRKLACEGDV